MTETIRSLFSTARRIDRRIEKVIDYYATDEERLAAEVEEYEVTENVEECFRKFLDWYQDGVQNGRVTEIGVWVSGFYGSGKSSFTKYLGFALDSRRRVKGRQFLGFLCDRFTGPQIPAQLKTLAGNHPAAVVLLDLGTDALVGNPRPPVSEVLYWKVLQWAGYPTKEKKLAHLMFTLERNDKFEDFKKEYQQRYSEKWRTIQDDPLLGVNRASKILPKIWPEEFENADKFQALHFEDNRTVRQLAQDMVDLCRRRTGYENVIFLVDEAGQYVAPNGQFILDFDGLSRCFKEIGQGKVWLVATGQQTLAEIVERAAYNSAELNRMKDRFPISIHLDARDIREITYRRLLTKAADAETALKQRFNYEGPSLCTHTRLIETRLYSGDPNADIFVRLYPFLPQHFDILLEMIRTLARTTGGIGLRSAIRVIQDVLVDKSRVLPEDTVKLADRKVGSLACVDNFYDTLRADIAKAYPYAVDGVNKVVRAFPNKPLLQRVAKAVAALQPLENFPKKSENIAALLYPTLGEAGLKESVEGALNEIISAKECGLIEDPQSGGYVFLSDKSKDERERRNRHIPTSTECRRRLVELMREGAPGAALFSSVPTARLNNTKDIRADVRLERIAVAGGSGDIDLVVELVAPDRWDQRRTELLTDTVNKPELKNTNILLTKNDTAFDDRLTEIAKSMKYLGETSETDADQEVARYIRSERRNLERNKETLAKSLEKAFLEATLIFQGMPKPLKEKGETLEAALRKCIGESASVVYSKYDLASIRPRTDLAARFLNVEKLQRMTGESDPLKLVTQTGGRYLVDVGKPVLSEVLRAFDEKVQSSGTGRLQGKAVQDTFASTPYGWTKDTVRYLFAALLRAGEIEFFISGVEGAVRTPVPQAIEAVKSTVAFNRIGIGRRGEKIPMEALDRAAQRLEDLFGEEVLPNEELISKAVRKYLPGVLEEIGSLADRLILLGLKGKDRAALIAQEASDLIKGDASGAASILGASDCRMPDDLRWARAVTKALNEGGDKDVRNAKIFLDDSDRIAVLFPDEAKTVLVTEDREAITDILDSENWNERLPDLKGLIGGIRTSTTSLFSEKYKNYFVQLEELKAELEAERSWSFLPDEEREAILDRLMPKTAGTPDEKNPLRSLYELLTAVSMLPGLKNDLLKQVCSFQPTEPISPNENGEAYLSVFELVPETEIDGSEDLDRLLNSIRLKVTELLKTAKKVIIR